MEFPMYSHHRPKRAHARIALLHEHVSPRGTTYLSGKAGPVTWTVSKILNPKEGGPTWVLMCGENIATPCGVEVECSE
jgi:hypothetical protein